MKKYLFKSKLLFFMNLLFAVLNSAASVYFAFILGNIVDISVSGNSLGFRKALYAGIIFMVLSTIFSYLIKISRGLFIKNSMSSLKKDIFSSILSKDISSFSSQNTADYISAINNDTNLIEQDYFTNILNSFQYISVFVLGTYAIFKLNIYIAIVVFAIGFIPLFIPIIFQKETGKRKIEYSNSLSSFTTKIKDIFTGFEVIKSSNIEEKTKEDFNKSNNMVENKKYSSTKMEAMVNCLSEFFGIMVFFVPLGLGTYLVLQGKFTTGGMLASVQLMNYIVGPILNFSVIVNKIKGIKPVNEKIEKIINENNHVDTGVIKNSFNKSIELKNLSFSYNEEREILKNVDLDINKGEKIAIVGRSGSGKSTLLRLILRYYDDYDGNILIDGMDIKNIKLSSIYEMMSIIQQNVFMFDDSIESNIALYGEYSDEEIDNAIRLSGLNGLIENLSKGKKSSVGENGSNLSGGEKQRISIARALIKNTPIVLLDEATASLDAETSFEIENSLLDIEGLTSLVVTHKLNSELLKKYDRIVVLEDGEIIEEGSFNELMDKKEFFYSLYSIEKVAA